MARPAQAELLAEVYGVLMHGHDERVLALYTDVKDVPLFNPFITRYAS